MKRKDCKDCANHIPVGYDHCPHCGRPRLFINVETAETDNHVNALSKRCCEAIARAKKRGCESEVLEFEKAVNSSKAVIGCGLSKLHALTVADGVFANYYNLIQTQFRRDDTVGKPNWNTLRPQVEIEFMGSDEHIRSLHYANLALAGESLPHYGECTVILREDMTAHRISVFEENSALYFYRNGPNIADGTRCSWPNRGRLAVAKLGHAVTQGMTNSDFPELLQKAGPTQTGLDDEFIELQVFGELTIRSFESIRLTERSPKLGKRKRKRRGTTQKLAVRDLCLKSNVSCTIK